MTTSTAERARELTAARCPFVHATVVRAQEPTSARAGDDAVILADGSIEGFVGGVCAETSVRAAAMETLRDGNSMLLRVLPEDSAEFPETPGALVVVNPCHSGGAIEIFLRPVLPKPLVAVAGESPIARAVADLAGFLDFEVISASSPEGVTAVVVAGLGRDEERAIRTALDTGVGLIALVASHTRSAILLDAMGLTVDERARIRPHAGIDIGARTPKEIALSVLAEIVREMRTASLKAAPAASSPASVPVSSPSSHAEAAAFAQAEPEFVAGPTLPVGPATFTPAATAIDPICGMTVVIGADTHHAVVDGQDFWYCCPGCLKKHTRGRNS
ncbi:XdhC family protein [Actinoplanes sp. NPDC026670]|uniref:XdhC family protein n=1 Tax=Actinoplanes sp. NPDC026670 TaxID=3154700 RepID=UPI00340B2FE6